ncbi:MAG: hypothetical protein R3F53_08525 [Gammaproteobacteria bacterium]
MRIGFLNGQDELILDPVYPIAQGATLPPFGARIKYNGTGRLKGRWEVVQPGDNTPTEFDLLTAATLPAEERSLQRRYTVLERFDVYLTPVGEVFLPGPRTLQPPTNAGGLHLVLLRIEASDARDSRSNTGNGLVVNAGGVAGFPMPVLRYFVGAADSSGASTRQQTAPVNTLALLTPAAQSSLPVQSLQFSWSGPDDVGFTGWRCRMTAVSMCSVPYCQLLPGSTPHRPGWRTGLAKTCAGGLLHWTPAAPSCAAVAGRISRLNPTDPTQ